MRRGGGGTSLAVAVTSGRTGVVRSARGDESSSWATRSPLRDGLAEAEQRTLEELELVRSSLGLATKAATTRDAAVVDKATEHCRMFQRRYEDIHERLLCLMA